MTVAKPVWPWESSTPGTPRGYGTTHGTPYFYDQRVPVILMGYGIQPGEYYSAITPADIAPTLASLCGITLAPRDGRILAEALKKSAEARSPFQLPRPKSIPPPAPNTNPCRHFPP